MPATAERPVIDPADHIQLAHWTATAFRRRYPHLNHEKDDVHAEAMIGLIKASRYFDPNFGAAFSTYASTSIYRHLWRMFLYVPMIGKRRCRQKTFSLDAQADSAGGCPKTTLAQEVADRRDDIESVDRLDAQRSVLDPLLRRLDSRKREVIRLLYWEGLTLEEAGDRIGITRERVRQLERAALWKMGMPFDRKPKLFVEGPTITDREMRLGKKRRADATPNRDKILDLMRELGCCTHTIAMPHLEAAGLSVTQPTFDRYRAELFPGHTPERLESPRVQHRKRA